MTVDKKTFRSVLGHFASGVVIVTSALHGKPLGLTVQSLIALSLDPPLVLFSPAKTSTTWPAARATGKFCVNILGEHQLQICQTFSASGGDKFATVDWAWSESGLPAISGCIAYVECELYETHEAGDHEIAIGAVQQLRLGDPRPPLVFFQGAYRQLSMAANSARTATQDG